MQVPAKRGTRAAKGPQACPSEYSSPSSPRVPPGTCMPKASRQLFCCASESQKGEIKLPTATSGGLRAVPKKLGMQHLPAQGPAPCVLPNPKVLTPHLSCCFAQCPWECFPEELKPKAFAEHCFLPQDPVLPPYPHELNCPLTPMGQCQTHPCLPNDHQDSAFSKYVAPFVQEGI